ncbi:hypothetical protein FB45DRAFT_946532 [Roridomyces roridus]|uniref:F-box domain-containing protein n=1 Tax=Roridomyces roridus TaxID=1738132 RepID=A0AAD7FA89_9AGAR|nr:hypothetical protein FB45DRAFT_946532 [Roridomyces roridus]
MSPSTNEELRAHLAAVDAAISAQLNHMQNLQNYRHSVLQELGAIVYPVLSLPNEITTEIFIQRLPDFPELNNNSRTLPLAPLGVCRAWRALAICTPQLLDLRSAGIRPRLGDLRDLIEVWFSPR